MPRIYHKTTIDRVQSILENGFNTGIAWFYYEDISLINLSHNGEVIAVMAFDWHRDPERIDRNLINHNMDPNILYLCNGAPVQDAIITPLTETGLVFHSILIGSNFDIDSWRELCINRDLRQNRIIIEKDVGELKGFESKNEAVEFFGRMIGNHVVVG